MLTNRVDPFATNEWIRVRTGLPDDYERLLMANYSIFYNIVAAYAQIQLGRRELAKDRLYHSETFFFFVRACIENLDDLKQRARKLLLAAGIYLRLPALPEDLRREIKSYRDVFAHKSHLGRGSQYGRGLILKRNNLPNSKTLTPLWTQSGSAPPGEMTDILNLQTGLWDQLAGVLHGTWKELAEAFQELRATDTFIQAAGLNSFLPIHDAIGTTVIPRITNPIIQFGA